MKIGVCASAVAGADLDEKMSIAAGLGFDSIEPTFGRKDHDRLSAEYGEELAERARKAGIPVSSAILSRTGNMPARIREGGSLDDELRILEGGAAAIKAVGGNLLLLPVMVKEAGADDEEIWLSFLREAGARTADTGVRLGLETLAQSAFAAGHEHVHRLVKQVDVAHLGVYYDVANGGLCGEDSVETLRMLGDRLFQIHMKDARGGVPKLESFPLADIRAFLSETEYAGRALVETPPPKDGSLPNNAHLEKAKQTLKAAGF